VRFVATAIDPRSRTFDIEVELDNASGRLKPEMVARLLVTRARLEDALVIDQDAVLRDEEGEHVFVVVDGRRGPVARRRSVEVTGRAGGRVVVEGVKAGARVVVAGQTKLIDGDRVDIEGEGRPPGPASNGVGPGHGASGED
jgi:multidrug efflux pump subunit AcrA (membrane-fusion protein)